MNLKSKFRVLTTGLACAGLAVLGLTPAVRAENPIVQTAFTADPAPVVSDGTLYLFTSHDEDETLNNFFTMKDWRCFSTTDMVNWTDHGVCASLKSFTWADQKVSGWGGFENGAWAPQAIERGGKWYLYVPLQGRGIGVLVANSPFGPYSDPIGKPLIDGKYDSIDPTVFIDDDSQAYLYWGNPSLWHARLNKDMISYDTAVGDQGLVKDPMTTESWGTRSRHDDRRATTYEEGPWLYKRQGLYYMFFAAGPISEHIGYSTSRNPEGPWKYGGVVMPTQGGSFTNHPGIVDYKGKTYLFYHNAGLPGGGGFRRSVCVDELHFGTDGSVIPRDMTVDGPPPAATFDPYRRVEAATINRESGIRSEPAEQGTRNIYATKEAGYIRIRGVDFGKAARSFMASVASESAGGSLTLRLDSEAGPVIGTCPISGTGGLQNWKTRSCQIAGATGVHDLYLVFANGGVSPFRLGWWRFRES